MSKKVTVQMISNCQYPDWKVDIKDNHLGIKLIPMISNWDQVDPIFPVRIEKQDLSAVRPDRQSFLRAALANWTR
jgi:hypothetical protein